TPPAPPSPQVAGFRIRYPAPVAILQLDAPLVSDPGGNLAAAVDEAPSIADRGKIIQERRQTVGIVDHTPPYLDNKEPLHRPVTSSLRSHSIPPGQPTRGSQLEGQRPTRRCPARRRQ